MGCPSSASQLFPSHGSARAHCLAVSGVRTGAVHERGRVASVMDRTTSNPQPQDSDIVFTGARILRLVQIDGRVLGGVRERRAWLLCSIERQYGRITTKGDPLGGRGFVGPTWVTGAKKNLARFYTKASVPITMRSRAPSMCSIDFRLSDSSWACGGPSRIQNQVNYLLILARQKLASQEICVYTRRTGKWNPRIVFRIGP